MPAIRLAVLAVSAAIIVACDRPASSTERGAVRDLPRPAYAVDSALPPGEAMRRFRAGLDSPARLAGPTSRDQLVAQFIAAARNKDRPALERLGVSRAEFAYLVFPESRWSKPPYNQPPDVEWLLLSAKSSGSLSKLLGRADRFELTGYSCDQPSEVDGPVRIWPGCVVHVREDGRRRDLRLFGSIIELGGRFKFRDFGNSF